MDPAQNKPPRKRRRWLIVAFVLVLVSLVSWWYWPRGDARFVGKWAIVRDGVRDPEYWILHPDGKGERVDPAGESVVFAWQFDGTVLKFSPPDPPPVGKVFQAYAQQVEVLSEYDNRVITRFVESRNNLELHRIPE